VSHDLVLSGCVSTVLGSYLKALGVHRLVTAQLDASAMSYWDRSGRFHLVSSVDRDGLIDFFVHRYAPTPLVTPWNGGSGFYARDQQDGIQAIAGSNDERFARYREVIGRCRGLLGDLGLTEKPGDKEAKFTLLRHARACLPDEAVTWLDAAYVIGDEARYPALLGTGGNDGRLDFANNFMQRVAGLFLAPKVRTGSLKRATNAADGFTASIFGVLHRDVLQQAAVGQFVPALAGGTNMTAGLRTEGRVNAWDFILALEGALTFAGTAVRRLDAARHGSASFPFHVNPSPIGYGSSAALDSEQARCELWLPLWPAPCTFPEIATLFGEARLEVGRRRATSGLDAARALATLGVDRGLDRFERLGILRRNGLSYLAAWLGTFEARAVPRVDLLRELDGWLGSIERLDEARPSVSAGFRRLEEAMFEACRTDRPLTATLAAIGNLERVVAASDKTRRAVRPLRGLTAAWHTAADDGSPEFAVASAVASWGIRSSLEPIENHRWSDRIRAEWTSRNALDNIVAIARRRIVAAESGFLPLDGRPTVSVHALGRLLDGGLDLDRLRDVLFGLSLIDEDVQVKAPPLGDVAGVDRSFCALRAVTSPRFLTIDDRHPSPKTVAAILARLAARDVGGALVLAERRLRASGCALRAPIREVSPRRDVQALAAALVIPLPYALEDRLVYHAVRPSIEMLETRETHR
jgi:CRISPR-associated protein Csx17